TGNRRHFAFDDPRLDDGVADNNNKFDITESESLLFGRNFGIVTDIGTGPNGNLFVVSLSDGAVYEIFRPSPGKHGGSRGGAQALSAPAASGVPPAPASFVAPAAAGPLALAAAPSHDAALGPPPRGDGGAGPPVAAGPPRPPPSPPAPPPPP